MLFINVWCVLNVANLVEHIKDAHTHTRNAHSRGGVRCIFVSKLYRWFALPQNCSFFSHFLFSFQRRVVEFFMLHFSSPLWRRKKTVVNFSAFLFYWRKGVVTCQRFSDSRESNDDDDNKKTSLNRHDACSDVAGVYIFNFSDRNLNLLLHHDLNEVKTSRKQSTPTFFLCVNNLWLVDMSTVLLSWFSLLFSSISPPNTVVVDVSGLVWSGIGLAAIFHDIRQQTFLAKWRINYHK